MLEFSTISSQLVNRKYSFLIRFVLNILVLDYV